MKKYLIVIDMQNDFIDGALGSDNAVAIVENVKEKISSYPVNQVIATKDTHDEDYLNSQEGKNLPIPHCIKNTEGWNLHHDIAELLTNSKIYEKPTFGSIELATDMKAMSEKEDIEIEVIGLCTDICVVSNVMLFKAFMPEVKITVDASCCAGVTIERHLAALETMKSCQVEIINDAIYELLDKNGNTYKSSRKGLFGGNKSTKVYGRMDCSAALTALKLPTRDVYIKNRVFFADEATALAAGYRPCGTCLREKYSQYIADPDAYKRSFGVES